VGWPAHDGTASTVSAAHRFAAGHPAVSCVLSGTADVHHLEQNVRDILGPPLTAADRRRLLEVFGPVRRKLGN
jgi:predicted aldo/keto reductase-like oxidoreductase